MARPQLPAKQIAKSTPSSRRKIGSAREGKCLHRIMPRTPKPKPKPRQDFGDLESNPRSTPVLEDSCTTPVVIPRKRPLSKETPPSKPRKVQRKVYHGSDDIFRGKFLVKIPAWMTETLKTIPSFPSPKRDREPHRQVGTIKDGREFSAVEHPIFGRSPEREESLTAKVAENAAQDNTKTTDGSQVLETSENLNREENISDILSAVCLAQETSDERLFGEVGEDLSCPTDAPINGIEKERDGSKKQTDKIEESQRQTQPNKETEDEERKMGETEQVGLDGNGEEEGNSTLDQSVGSSSGMMEKTIAADPETLEYTSYRDSKKTPYEKLEREKGNTQSQPPTNPDPQIIFISDDESECRFDSKDMHKLSRRQESAQCSSEDASTQQQELHRALTPDSLPPPPTRTTPYQPPPLRQTKHSLEGWRTSKVTVNRSRWRNPTKAPQTRFSGPQILTPLTLHPIESGMGWVDRSHYPQHEGVWKRSTQELLNRFGASENPSEQP